MTKQIKSLSQYAGQLQDAINGINVNAVESVIKILTDAFNNGHTVYFAGNGGSAAISSHSCTDLCKVVACDTNFYPRIVSLPDNSSMITAIANDIGYEDVFAKQLEWSALAGEVLVVISSSGKSPNIVKALKEAKKLNMKTIAIVGFTGGPCKDLADVCIHIPSNNYGIVEDSSMATIHYIAQTIRVRHSARDEDLIL